MFAPARLTRIDQRLKRDDRPQRQRRGVNIAHVGGGLLFAVVFYSIPWESLRKSAFTDRLRFIENFYDGVYVADSSGSTLSLWLSEILWRRGVLELAGYLGTFEAAFALLSAVALCLMVIYATSRAKSPLFLVLLISPMFVDLVFSQIRSALAIAILYTSLLIARGRVGAIAAVLLVGCALFIHQFAIVPLTLVLAHRLAQTLSISHRARLILLLVPMLASLLALTVFRETILLALSDRRAGGAYDGAGGFALAAMVFSLSVPAWLNFRNAAKDIDTYIVIVAGVLQIGIFLGGVEGSTRIMALALPALSAFVSRIREDPVRHGTLVYALACNSVYFVYWARFA